MRELPVLRKRENPIVHVTVDDVRMPLVDERAHHLNDGRNFLGDPGIEGRWLDIECGSLVEPRIDELFR